MEIHLQQVNDFISAQALSKGAEYFYNGLISEIKWSENILTGIAAGTHSYKIQITIKNDIITNHSCSCPINNKEFCKHKAGLIIYLQEQRLNKMLRRNNLDEE